jgi:hypothetical protein
MQILRVYEVHMTPADTPRVAWQDIGPLRYKGGVMRPSELVHQHGMANQNMHGLPLWMVTIPAAGW